MRQPTAAEWATIRDWFDRLADKPPEHRLRSLREAALEPYVATRVRAMLDADTRGGVLDGAAAPAAVERPSTYASLAPGAEIGRFRIDRLIGRGGSGEVYRATRADGTFTQHVALKLLRPEAAERAALFDRERALLASLEHPGIARLIDGGIAPDGRPFMALEYVEGVDIATWCRAHQAGLETRLRLFLEVADAVAYAHARLVMHRDIKPGNILIDGDGRARLLDFGIARLLDEGVSERTLTRALMTPEYAAPEQLENARTTVATDVYALGALLFELLVGCGPWTGGDASLPAVVRRVLHEDPPLPSRRAARTRAAPVPPQRLAGDLDAIVLKAMRRMPADRYAGAADLAGDVRRHLAFEPVQARGGNARYHAARFLRRNRWGVVAAAMIALALAAGVAGISWQARQTAIERDAARAEAERLEAINQATMLMFRNAGDTARLGDVTVRQMIEGTRRLVEAMPPRSSETAATVGALADMYLIVENRDEAKTLLAGALARGVGGADRVAVARLKLKLGTILIDERRFAAADRLLADAGAIWATDPPRYRAERVETLGALAQQLHEQGHNDRAIALLAAGMDDADEAYIASNRDLATRYAQHVNYLREGGRLAETTAILQRGQEVMARRGQAQSSGALTLRRIEGEIAGRQGDFAAAETLLRQVISARRTRFGRSAALAADLFRYGQLLGRAGRHGPALAVLDESWSVASDHFGPAGPPTQRIAMVRVETLAALGRSADAAAALAAIAPAGRLNRALYRRARAAVAIAEGRHRAAAIDLDAAERELARLGADDAWLAARRLRARL